MLFLIKPKIIIVSPVVTRLLREHTEANLDIDVVGQISPSEYKHSTAIPFSTNIYSARRRTEHRHSQ